MNIQEKLKSFGKWYFYSWPPPPWFNFFRARKNNLPRTYMYLLIGLFIGLIIALFKYGWIKTRSIKN